MPPRSIVFTVLGAALYLSAVALGDELVTLNATVGRDLVFEMGAPTGAIRCEVQTNTGMEFSLRPRGESTPSGIVQPLMSELFRDCGMHIRSTTIDQRGEWTIRAITESSGQEIETIQRFLVQFEGQEDEEEHVTENEEQEDDDEEHHEEDEELHIEYLASETLNATVGTELSFTMSSPNGVDRCEVQQNDGTEFSLLPRDQDTPADIVQPMISQALRDCGMHIWTPSIDQEGQWTIRAFKRSNERNTVTVKHFMIQFYSQDDEDHVDEDEDQDSSEEEDPEEDEEQHIEYLASETLNATVGIGLSFAMSSPNGVDRCQVQQNDGTEFSLLPRDQGTPTDIVQPVISEALRDCGMHIRTPSIDQEGEWTIQAFKRSNGQNVVTVKRFLVQFISQEDEEHDDEDEEQDDEDEDQHDEDVTHYELVDVFPSRMVTIFPGNSMSLRLRNRYENLTGCIATSPNGVKFDVLNNANDISASIRTFDQCGVTVRVNDGDAGLWQLNATIGNYASGKLNYYGNFLVDVRNSSAIYAEPTVIHVQRSASASITVGPSDAVSCQLRNPRGDYLPLHSGRCQADIPIVTDVHEGYWTAFYSLQGKVNVVVDMTEVVAYDDRSLNATVTTSDNGNVNLLCRVRAYSFSFCQFVKPNGTVLNVFEGIGNDRYLYHGEGFQGTSMLTKNPIECGITILNPDVSDYGNWKCILSTSSGLTGSILSVPIHGQDGYEYIRDPLESGDNVYVAKGESFTVKCEVNAELRYCWLGSPNGTAYSVSSTETSPTTLRYSGMGLALGECGAVIPAAEYTDEGEWKCWMGVSNGQEVGSIVHVLVSDTILMPVARNVTVRRDQTHLQLSCSLIPGHEESIDYCRWIQPGGFGLGNWKNLESSKNEEPAMTYNTESHCYLEIKNIQEFQYVGEWTCVAGLVGSAVEVSATIDVMRRPRSNSGNRGIPSLYYYIIGLVISAIIAGVAAAVFRVKSRLREKQGPPPEYEETGHFEIPRVTTPHETS